MSENKAQAYLESLDEQAFDALFEGKEDASFEEVVAAIKQAGDTAGFSFTEDEMAAELDQSLEAAEDGELSDDQLEEVAGGFFSFIKKKKTKKLFSSRPGSGRSGNGRGGRHNSGRRYTTGLRPSSSPRRGGGS